MKRRVIHVRAYDRTINAPRPKWLAYHHASNTFLQSIKGRIVTDQYPPNRLQFRVALKKYLKEMDGEDWADGWSLWAIR